MKAGSKTLDRSAGILLPLFSLPSPYGIGDMGMELYRFADFLHRSGQKYWQLLPLNSIDWGTGYSPYSSISSMAGNVLYISPELLAEEGLLDKEKVKELQLPFSERLDHAVAEKIKYPLLTEAYDNYKSGDFTELKRGYDEFCNSEAHWLGNFALYVTIKKHQEYKPWYLWAEHYRKYETAVTEPLPAGSEEEIERIKWQQYIFFKQWKAARAYCNSKGIKVMGDLSFYVAYDSADVWANQAMFKLDADGRSISVAGVPPDYFSITGQLWGMPIYNWEHMKTDRYGWWIARFRKNLELFDVVRLDHFRAFAAYWEVLANEETAINGKWINGAGKDFFDTVERTLGSLPFVAEDLGNEMDEVYALRDEVGVPGMKILQYAWGENAPTSVDAPHNFSPNCIVYTGTHDNNTTKGWLKYEAGNAGRERLEQYTGMPVNEDNIDEILCRMAYASVAAIAIIPIQDILGLDEHARINTPGSATDNWCWRLSPQLLTPGVEQQLLEWVKIYDRQ